jgi:hypothetical protein
MNRILLNLVFFLMTLALLFEINIMAFRSEIPSLLFLTLPISIIILITFPYKKFFNLK